MANKLKKLSKPVLIEMIGSLLLLLCMFLPWVSISFKEMNSVSFSLINRALLADLSNWIYTSINEQTGWDAFNYGYLLFLFPIMCLVNIVIQCIVRIPWLSFYTAVASAFTVVSAYYFFESLDIGSPVMGIGMVLAGIISLFLMIYVWTNLGWNYKKHWIYLVVVLICCIAIGVISYIKSKDDILSVIGFIIHVPFLIYALFVAICSYIMHLRKH